MTFSFTDSTGAALAQSKEVEVSTVQKIIPDGTTLEVTVIGVEIAPEDNYGNHEHIVVSTVVTAQGEYRGIECNHKLHINDSKDSKADKAKAMLLAYDSNIKGHLFKAANEGKNIIDQGILNRALNGGVVSATFAEWAMPIQYRDESGVLKDALNDDGTAKERKGNWIKKISPRPSTSGADAAIVKQATNQPAAPVAVAPVSQPVQADIASDDIPF
jgi:hypothetical protein